MTRKNDNSQLRQIQDESTARLTDESESSMGGDPYSKPTPATPPKTPRRTLDDMRKLSEEIKRNRQRK